MQQWAIRLLTAAYSRQGVRDWTGIGCWYVYTYQQLKIQSAPRGNSWDKAFAQVSHEYLIEQLQFTGDESTSSQSNKIKLNFNHPVKSLLWVVQRDDNVSELAPQGKQWFNYSDSYDYTYSSTGSVTGAFTDATNPIVPTSASSERFAGAMPGVAAGGANNVFVPVSFEDGKNPVVTAKLQLNGHDRFSERDGRYFNLVQPYQHFENVPSVGVNVYSFGLKPEEHQPSGTCNMSRIDNATLQLTLSQGAINTGSKTCKVRVYAVNYNVKCALKSYPTKKCGNFLREKSVKPHNIKCL